MASNHHLYLIRHLPTAGNREKKYIGWTDEPIEPVEDKDSDTDSSMPAKSDCVWERSDCVRRKARRFCCLVQTIQRMRDYVNAILVILKGKRMRTLKWITTTGIGWMIRKRTDRVAGKVLQKWSAV